LTKRAPVAITTAGILLEREAELRAVEELLEAGRGSSGRLLLVEGHAGIGKSSLLDAAVARGRSTGMTVMRARASELESAFAFGIALQLFEPLLAGADDETHDRLLAGSAALAGPLLERPTSWGGDEAADRSYPVMHGLFWLLSNLAEADPVLIAIDDAHWADRPSLRLVLYLLQRLDEMHVSIIAARRLGEPGAPDDLLGQIAAHVTSRRVRPAALSHAGARTMVVGTLGDADQAFVDACWRMTEGNVFLLGELLGAVESKGWKPTKENAPRIGTLAPEAVLRAVAVRLMRLSDDAAGVARAVAVLGDDAHLRHVAALTNRQPDRVAAAADALAASEILRPAGPGVLRFAHPLLASAVYADVGTGERAALHRRAAEILRDEDISAERVAAHLLPSPGTGEPWVVEALSAAASGALRLGVPESAASYLRRALDEPPELSARSALLRQLGVSEAATGLATAIDCLQEALAVAVDERDRAQTLLVLGRTLGSNGRHREALDAFDEAAASEGADASISAQARAESAALGLLDPERRDALLAMVQPPTTSQPGPASPAERELLAIGCLRQAMLGASRGEIRALAERALAGDEPLADEGAGGTVLFGLSTALLASDELAWNDSVLTAAMTQSRAQGSMMALATASLGRSVSRWEQGRLIEALADAEQAVGAERYGWRHFLPWAYGVLVGIHVERGELEVAAIKARRFDPKPYAGSAMLARWHEALGCLAFAERRDGDALAQFEAWRDVVVGVRNPACFAAWRSASAHPLARLGRTREASELAREELELARAFGAPRAISVALRALAHADAYHHLDRPIGLLEEAVEVLAGSDARLERSRALLDLGTVLRRAGRRSDAGRALGEALEIARACGARLVEERATEELEVAGTRVQRAALRGADALSPSERRVVGLAVEGLTNRQIAEALFVTRKAVEWHLGNAYRKLDVRSRHELAAALEAPQEHSR
jgi:DNA-binding CsgD family transcriptional regulator